MCPKPLPTNFLLNYYLHPLLYFPFFFLLFISYQWIKNMVIFIPLHVINHFQTLFKYSSLPDELLFIPPCLLSSFLVYLSSPTYQSYGGLSWLPLPESVSTLSASWGQGRICHTPAGGTPHHSYPPSTRQSFW